MGNEPSSEKPGSSALLSRVEREAGVPGLAGMLAERLAPTDLQSLLLEVHRRAARRITPLALLQQYARNRFVRPYGSDPRELARFDRLAFELLPEGWEPVELSPVAPLGASSALATVDQNKVLATDRNTELVADSTNVLALESALRRKSSAGGARPGIVRLCASHRFLRAQRYDEAGAHAHFRVLALTSAGRARADWGFELDMLREHLDYYLRLVRAVEAAEGSALAARVSVTDLTAGALGEPIARQVFSALSAAHPAVELRLDPERRSGRGYYLAACFKIHVRGRSSRDGWLEVGDGGFADWMGRLLSDNKERLLVSGVSSERVMQLARGGLPPAARRGR